MIAEKTDKPPSRVADLARGVQKGQTKELARAITLCESANPADFDAAAELLEKLGTVADGKTMRIGISGPPGVGKSSFIEALGLLAAAKGKKTAVLAVDPQSQRGGGAILGDKTRMPKLSESESAFVRPSAGAAGGIHPNTHEAIACCEAANFNLIIVETIGSGQWETDVRRLVDMFCLLVMPGGGDEVQGIKRGAMELADLLIVTKCDGDLKAGANLTAAQYSQGLTLMRRNWENWSPSVVTVSAHSGENLSEIWAGMEEFFAVNEKEIAAKRKKDRQHSLRRQLADLILKQAAALRTEKRLAEEVAAGRCPPRVAAALLVPSLAAKGTGQKP